ncbi:MAG: hypothetical protein O2990_07655 [Bacteroidetes bacterium]|nr:hypothetical protein [Bacteroidota bacterium]
MDFDPRTEWRPEDWEATSKALRRAEWAITARKAGGVAASVLAMVGSGWAMSVVAPEQWEAVKSVVVEVVEPALKAVRGGEAVAEAVDLDRVESEAVAPIEPSTESRQTAPELLKSVPVEAVAVEGEDQALQGEVVTWEQAVLEAPDAERVDPPFQERVSNDVVAPKPKLEETAPREIEVDDPEAEPVVLEVAVRPLDLEPLTLRSLDRGNAAEAPGLKGAAVALSVLNRTGLRWSATVEPVHGSATLAALRTWNVTHRQSLEASMGLGWDGAPVHWSAWHPTDAFGAQEWRVARSDRAVVSWAALSAMHHVSPTVRVGATARVGVELSRELQVGVQDPATLTWVEGSEPEVSWGRVTEATPWRLQPGVRGDVAVAEGWWLTTQVVYEANWRGARDLGPIEVEQHPIWVQIGLLKW